MSKEFTTDIDALNEMRERYEPLREELHKYVRETPCGYFIRHPFCIEPIHDLDRCALIHYQIDQREPEADGCFEAGDWEGYIDRIALQLQPEWLAKDANLLSDDRYWATLGRVYQNQTVIHVHMKLFERLFHSDRPGRENLMTPEEQRILHRLPDVLTVYRGFDDDLYWDEASDGISWTLDRRAAVWFANYNSESPSVVTGRIPKASVWAYLMGGEVLLPAEAVVDRKYRLSPSAKARRLPLRAYTGGRFDERRLLEG